MTPERALYTALSAMSGLSDADGNGVTEGLIHSVKRYAFLFAILVVAAKLNV